MAKLHDLQRSKFASINPDAFLTLQQSWKEEVRLKFEEFKKKEEVCVCVCCVCVCVHILGMLRLYRSVGNSVLALSVTFFVLHILMYVHSMCLNMVA